MPKLMPDGIPDVARNVTLKLARRTVNMLRRRALDLHLDATPSELANAILLHALNAHCETCKDCVYLRQCGRPQSAAYLLEDAGGPAALFGRLPSPYEVAPCPDPREIAPEEAGRLGRLPLPSRLKAPKSYITISPKQADTIDPSRP